MFEDFKEKVRQYSDKEKQQQPLFRLKH